METAAGQDLGWLNPAAKMIVKKIIKFGRDHIFFPWHLVKWGSLGDPGHADYPWSHRKPAVSRLARPDTGEFSSLETVCFIGDDGA